MDTSSAPPTPASHAILNPALQMIAEGGPAHGSEELPILVAADTLLPILPPADQSDPRS